MEKKQTGTGRPKPGTTEKRKRPDSESRIINTGSDQNHAEKGKDRKIVAILIILLVVVIFALMLQFKGRNNGDFSKVHLDMPEFEDSVVYDGSGEEKAAKDQQHGEQPFCQFHIHFLLMNDEWGRPEVQRVLFAVNR